MGQTTLKILEERNFPVRDIRLFASARSVGKKMTFKGEQLPVEEVTTESFKGIDFAFFSGGRRAVEKIRAACRSRPAPIMIESRARFGWSRRCRWWSPEINGAAARKHQGIVSCPNCTTIVTVMPLKPLHDAGKLKRVVATSFQAVSGAGVGGIEELRAQAMAWSKGEKLPRNSFSIRSRSTCFRRVISARAAIPARKPNSSKRCGKSSSMPDLPVCPTTVPVPVFTTHSISVNAETERKVTAAQARAAFEHFPGVRVYDDPAQNQYPMPILVEGQDDCFVGRIREDISIANGINFWVVGDQLRKGAALNGIQIAEFLIDFENLAREIKSADPAKDRRFVFPGLLRRSATAADKHIVEVRDRLVGAHRGRLEAESHALASESTQVERLERRNGSRATAIAVHDLGRRESAQYLRRTDGRNRAHSHSNRADNAPALEADHLPRCVGHGDLLFEEPIGAARYGHRGEGIAKLRRHAGDGAGIDAQQRRAGNHASSIGAEAVVEVAVLDEVGLRRRVHRNVGD